MIRQYSLISYRFLDMIVEFSELIVRSMVAKKCVMEKMSFIEVRMKYLREKPKEGSKQMSLYFEESLEMIAMKIHSKDKTSSKVKEVAYTTMKNTTIDSHEEIHRVIDFPMREGKDENHSEVKEVWRLQRSDDFIKCLRRTWWSAFVSLISVYLIADILDTWIE